jgi:glycosyltransferase involved in cell wall biosynthesis
MTRRDARVLYVSALGERGGVEVVLLNILRCLDHSQFVPAVVLLQDGPFAREVRDTGTDTWVVQSGRVRNLMSGTRAVLRLRKIIKQERIDVVHTLNAKAHLYGGSAAALSGKPCIYHLHGVPKPSLTRDGVVSLLSLLVPANRTIACSRYVAETFRNCWRSRRDVAVVHNGSLARAKTAQALTIREEFGVPSAVPLIATIGRLQKGKGVHVFLDAASRVMVRCPEARFLVVGGALFGLEQQYPADLRRDAERRGLTRALTFTGYRADIGRFFNATDVVVQASIEPEAFGMVLLEAMAAGRPVIATNHGGPREIVVHGETGFLVPPNRADLLAESILTLVQDPSLRLRMGRAGAARFEAQFLASRMAERLQAIYTELVSRTAVNGRAP